MDGFLIAIFNRMNIVIDYNNMDASVAIKNNLSMPFYQEHLIPFKN